MNEEVFRILKGKEKELLSEYWILKKMYAKIEGNINELEHHGIDGFKCYVAYGIASYNLSKLGKMLNEEERAQQTKLLKKAKKRQKKAQRAKLRVAA